MGNGLLILNTHFPEIYNLCMYFIHGMGQIMAKVPLHW